MQVLTVINPKVTYTPKGPKGKLLIQSTVTGVAVWLKGFLKQLDKHGIAHPNEVDIRKQLRDKSTCDTRMKQYFHRKKTKAVNLGRQDQVCRPCVCIPREDVPEGLFDAVFGQ